MTAKIVQAALGPTSSQLFEPLWRGGGERLVASNRGNIINAFRPKKFVEFLNVQLAKRFSSLKLANYLIRRISVSHRTICVVSRFLPVGVLAHASCKLISTVVWTTE